MRLECEVCRKTFRTKNGLNWHLENIHGQVKTFEVDDSSANDVGHQAADLHNPLAAVNVVAQGVAVVEKVQRMMGQSGPLPATQAELVELIEGVIGEQVNDGTSATSGLLDLREIDLKVQIRQMIAEMIGDSDRFLREHIEHRLDDRLQAITPIHQEATKVKDGSNALAPYLRDDRPSSSDPLAPYLADDRPASSDPLAPYRRKWPAATPAKVGDTNPDKSCPLSATGKRCDHLEPARQHATLRAITFPETPIREQAKPAKVVEMERHFPGPLTGCLSHSHEQSRDLESSTSRTWWPDSEQLRYDRIVSKALEELGYAV